MSPGKQQTQLAQSQPLSPNPILTTSVSGPQTEL